MKTSGMQSKIFLLITSNWYLSNCFVLVYLYSRRLILRKTGRLQKIKIFLISLKAGGVGLNLTKAEYVFLLDPWWNPAVESQAIDRAHRIGQENKVMIYKFITHNTVEEKIMALQERKMALAGELISTEESFMKTLSKDDIKALLE